MALIVGGATVTGTQVLDATKLSGNLPALDGSSLVSLNASELDSGTVANARISSGSVTQHVDLSNLNASNLTSGSIPNARVPSGAVTQHVSAVTQQTGTWTPTVSHGGINTIYATYARTGNIVTCVANWNYDGSGRSNTSTAQYYMAGLPFTSRSGSVHVGSGSFSFYYGRGYAGILRVPPSSSQIYFYGHGADITTSNARTSGSADQLQSALTNTADNGYRIILKNMYNTMISGQHGHLFIVYQV